MTPLYDAALAQRRDVSGGAPELAEDLVGLLAEERGVVPYAERLPRDGSRPADGGERASVRVDRLVDDLARPDVGVVEDVLGPVGRAYRDVVVERERHPLVPRARVEDLLDLGRELGPACVAEVDRVRLVDLSGQVRPSDRGAEVAPELRLDSGQHHELAVLGLVVVVLRAVRVADARDRGHVGDAAGVPPGDVLGAPQRDGRVRAGRVDERSLAGAAALLERGHRGERSVQGAHDRGAERSLEDRRGIGRLPDEPVLAHLQVQGAALRHHHVPVHRDLRVGPSGPEPAALQVDDVRLDLPLRLVADAEPLAGRAGEAVDKDVGRAQQLPEQLAPLVPAQVDGDAALVAVVQQVVGAVLRGDDAADIPDVIAGLRVLDLDDVSAEVTEQPAGVPALHQDCALQHPYPAEEADHPHPLLTAYQPGTTNVAQPRMWTCPVWRTALSSRSTCRPPASSRLATT